MAINIPASVFEKLNEAILLFNRTCTLVYPERKDRCGNCIQNTIGGRSVNTYRSGGPIPFNRGSLCPLCGGKGVKLVEETKSVEMRVYHNRRDFINVGFNADIPSNVIQTIGYMSDYDDIIKAKELLVDVGSYRQGRYKRMSEPFVQGFKQNPTQYVVVYWERV
tara:strand:+ start:1427 stop:1918 length:492 start_codon:yes stop_codon:yes gene_type:complete